MHPLYTEALTPRTDISDEIAGILFEGEQPPPKSRLRAQFDRLPEADRRAVVAYCEELDCLHEDLGFIREELDQAVTILYRDSLHLKRLSMICHEDNFHFRVHAYREKVFKLLNHFLGLKLRDEPGFNRRAVRMLEDTKRMDLAGLLTTFERDKDLRKAIDFRHLLAHARAHREWPTVTAGRRIDDHVLARSASYEIDRLTDLDNLHRRVQTRLGRVSSRLDQFRVDLIAHLERAVSRR